MLGGVRGCKEVVGVVREVRGKERERGNKLREIE